MMLISTVLYTLAITAMGGNLASAFSFTHMARFLGIRDDTNGTGAPLSYTSPAERYSPWSDTRLEVVNDSTFCHIVVQTVIGYTTIPDKAFLANRIATVAILSNDFKELYAFQRLHFDTYAINYIHVDFYVPGSPTLSQALLILYLANFDRNPTIRFEPNGNDNSGKTYAYYDYNHDAWNHPKAFNLTYDDKMTLYHAAFPCFESATSALSSVS